MGSFGDKFRKERERQGIKLEDVSNSTKIGSRMLRAIEEEHFDQLPGGVFNKGFIRAYAKHLGLDEEETITGYVAALNQFNSQQLGLERPAPLPPVPDRRTGQHADRRQSGDRSSESRRSAPDPPANAQPGTAPRVSAPRVSAPRVNDQRVNDQRVNAPRVSDQRVTDQRRNVQQDVELPDLQLPKAEHVRPRRRMAVHSDFDGAAWRLPALLVLLIVVGIFWWSHSRSARANGANSAAANVTPAAGTSTPPPASAAGNDGAAAAAASSHASSPAHTAARTASHSSSPASSPTTSSAAVSAQAAGSANSVNSAGTRENASQPENETPPAPRTVANLTLVIRASENSWIAVTADGQPVVQETLIAPAHTSVRASREIVVRAGNSAGVTFALNGQEFPSQGAEGEVKTLIFDNTGLRPAVPATTPAPSPTAPPSDPTR